MKTYSQKQSEVARKWYVIDASEAPLGRVSTVAASLLIGKGKPSITPHVDNGDFVVIINSDNLKVTGGKETKKMYYRHSSYPGGLKSATLEEKMAKDSTQVITLAIRGMLPVNKLRPDRLARLKVYKTSEHSHNAQKPEVLSVKGSK
ncbi:MAG TPA: 50S ribosomal protein L13 [Candidatus Saccharibacteria bacterium]|nr:50S ribosomal protein L13 [Candidatus Saccharibacteria bacterium]